MEKEHHGGSSSRPDSPEESNHMDMELSVVVPVLNEEDNIAPLISEIRSSLDGVFNYEVIYVDDGSDDETPQRLARTAKDFNRLRIVRHKNTCGQSTALLTGVRAARSPWIATLDGDGQNNPADILRLWKRVYEEHIQDTKGGLLVIGHRLKRRDNWLKRWSSKIANFVRARLLKDDTPDTGSGLKLFGRETFLQLPYFDHMHRFLPALVMRNGGRVISVAVSHRERERGKSKYGLHDRLWVGIVDILGVMWLQRRVKRPVLEGKE